MKHPDPKLECFEFNLSKAPGLRCVRGEERTPMCGECEGCCLREKLVETKGWFLRAGDQTRRRFALGIVRRLNSVDLLQYVISMLQPLLCKDFTYARARTTPSLSTDSATMSSNRALPSQDTEATIADTWFWFQSSNYWSKSNFLLGLLQMCSAVLLHQVGQQAQTLVTSERKAFKEQDDYESASIASTTYSFRSDERKDLALLTTTRSEYSAITKNPFASPTDPSEPSTQPFTTDSLFCLDEIINDDSGDDYESELSSVDPTCMVIPASIKAYSGVARHRDFIRSLPVHLSKYILGFLDKVSLHNCVCVSRHWRILIEEVHKEYYVNQRLWEEVMLMQGSAAQGCNPVYAKDVDVAVPNLHPNSFTTIRNDSGQAQTKFKSEVTFKTAYMGYSTRNIIMEERNVYCGAYNVMVLINSVDPARVIHTDGSHLVVTGSTDRKVRFVDTETAHEVEPLITGHAGSVRCVFLNHKQGYVLSGSYDTSIRQWSLETGKCMKIFRGHRDSVLCMALLAAQKWLASGAKDKMVKVWDIESAKCIRTFKHRQPITAVAISEDKCISGCEGGQVKVWDMRTGALIKKLSGHHASVTAIRFDKWHVITGGRDGYALAWSAQGDHSRCLTALRHPKEVLCLEFIYLRAITGSEDGKLRIWNILSGQCLRIMRGNSRSDPITELVAIGDRLTINTSNNTLVLNFEPIEFDYTLETDKMPSMIQYGKYSDAPVRLQPYSYIRAQRMKKAGASNTKLVYHDGEAPTTYHRNLQRPAQTAHSAKTLSSKTMDQARKIQSAGARMQRAKSMTSCNTRIQKSVGPNISRSKADVDADAGPGTGVKRSGGGGKSMKSVSIYGKGKPPVAPSMATKSKVAMSTRSGTSVVGFQLGATDDDSDISGEEYGEMQRRVSWAFEHPSIPKTKELSLSETKALLRSQIRAKEELVPPDFIYLTVNAIQNSMKQTDAFRNMEIGRIDPTPPVRVPGRPTSSPSRCDPRARVPVEDLDLDHLMMESDLAPRELDMHSSAVSVASHASRGSRCKQRPPVPHIPKTATIVTEFGPCAVDAAPQMSIHSRKLKSNIPKARLLRPHTAALRQAADPANGQTEPRPQSASTASQASPSSKAGAFPVSLAINAAMGPVQVPGQRAHAGPVKTSASQRNYVPMLMYPPDMNEKLASIRQRRISRQNQEMEGRGEGRVSSHNAPLRDHVDFKLHTHQQVENDLEQIAYNFKMARRKKIIDQDKKQKEAWLKKVRGISDMDYSKRRKSRAPELGEYAPVESVA